jgi:hypothetical protein
MTRNGTLTSDYRSQIRRRHGTRTERAVDAVRDVDLVGGVLELHAERALLRLERLHRLVQQVHSVSGSAIVRADSE